MNKAIAEKTGTRRIFYSKACASNSFYSGEEHKQFIWINTISLNNFIKELSIIKVDFLKMDCEGSELEIFLNCQSQILKKISKISMEYHPVHSRYNIIDIKNKLIQNGFSVEIDTKYNKQYAINLNISNYSSN